MSQGLGRFAEHYRGRHSPDDALWWLADPTTPGPSGAPPPNDLFFEAAEELRSRGLHDAASALLAALEDLLLNDRRATVEALESADLGHLAAANCETSASGAPVDEPQAGLECPLPAPVQPSCD